MLLVWAVEFVPNGCLVFGAVLEKQLCMKPERERDLLTSSPSESCLVLLVRLSGDWRVGRKKLSQSMRQKNDKTAGKTSIVVICLSRRTTELSPINRYG